MFDDAFWTKPFHAGGISTKIFNGFFGMIFAKLRKRLNSLI